MKTNRARMLSDANSHMLFDHILDGFRSSHEGIEQLKQKQLIDESRFAELMEKNSQRLIDRIKEFKIMLRITCLAFAMMFTTLQVKGDDLDMRRSSRTRTTRSARGRRRNEDVVALF